MELATRKTLYMKQHVFFFTSTFLLLFHLDYWMIRWWICDYLLIFNEHQL